MGQTGANRMVEARSASASGLPAIQTLPSETLRTWIKTATNGAESELYAARDRYIQNGLTPEKAGQKAIQDVLKRYKDVFENGREGPTAQAITEAVERERLNCALAGENIRHNGMEQELIEAALAMPPDSEARNMTERYMEQAQTAQLEQLDALEAKLKQSHVENEEQLQALARAVEQRDAALEALGETTPAASLTSEQLGRISETLRRELEGLEPAANLPTDQTVRGTDRDMQQLRLAMAWENEKGELTEGEFHGKVNSENPSSNGRFKDILADGYVDQAKLEKDPAAFKHVSINEMADFLQSIGYRR